MKRFPVVFLAVKRSESAFLQSGLLNTFSDSLLLVFAAELHNGELGFVPGRTYTQMEGKNITVSCSFTFSGRTMYFCKTDCSRENILVETTDYRAQSGRYIIEFNRTGFASHVVYVSITELKTSDSGWYRCTLGRIQHDDFKIVVVSGEFFTAIYSKY